MSDTDEPTAPATIEPTVPIRVVRAQLEAQQKTLAEEGEQARSMIEQGQQLLQQGSDGLKQIAGAKIAVKKQLDDLDAYMKSQQNA